MRSIAAVLFLTITGSVAVNAQENRFGEWTVDFTNDKTNVYAATANDSGSVLGEYCSLEKHVCNWMLAMDTACEGAGVFPLLGNAASGSVQLGVTCGGKVATPSGQVYQYFFTSWKDLELLLKDSGLVGFAFPLADGQFKVTRFSLTGRTDAMALAESVMTAKPKSDSRAMQTGTSDTTL
jgi:hypothetical protein